ncbi:MAG: 50S ribosomal protein L32 [Staphylococcus epidermidis]|nr:50S ribosomal protein L32 [Staphylococcus epidermidis]
MAVPKRRTSKTRKNKRRTHYKLSHRVCKNCGSYNGEEVVSK